MLLGGSGFGRLVPLALLQQLMYFSVEATGEHDAVSIH